ncbi:MAG: hypothetical protein QF738_04055 [Rhodospirillales bacterium]|nr:hypothetical protein [Rhodospirillales bacterium]
MERKRAAMTAAAASREPAGQTAARRPLGGIRRPVMLAADQTPEYADIRKAGHDGGDFLFVRVR